jgi:lipopolysaccharide transport system permease protein
VTGYFSDIWRLRHFWMALVQIDLRKRYRRSVIGVGWSLLHPIAMTIVLCVVFSRLFNVPDPRAFASNFLSGLTFWGFLMASVMQGCQSFLQGEPYIRQHPAPLAIYPLRVTLGAGFHFLLGFGVVLIYVWSINGFGNLPALPILVPIFLLVFILGWALAVCMGLANVLFQDSQHLIEIVMQIAFYATPIIYTPEMMLAKGRIGMWIIRANPLAAFLELIRRPLLDGAMPSWWAIGMAGGTTAAAVAVAMLALKRFEKRLVFYL